MYKYYQVGPKSPWQLIPEGANTEQQAIDLGARKLTILAVSHVVDEATPAEEIRRSGPWYCDIDCKDLKLAILSAIALVMKLRDLGVPDGAIEVFASGSKGFHIVVKESVFSSGRALKGLHTIYKEMALELYVIGIDFQVYSGGRGVCWRLPNIQREDGKYKVPITVDELMDMTPEWYQQLVSTPRILPKPDVDPGLKAFGMEALMDRAKKRVRNRPAQPEPIADEKLADFREEPPPCVTDMAEYKIRPSRNFNEAALQMGIFLARAGVSDTVSSSLASRMAANGSSNSYTSPHSREEHLTGLIGYLKYTPSKQFSCNAVRSVISTRPCEDCSLCLAGEEEAEVGEDVGLVERADGYYVLGQNGERRISTFILKATKGLGMLLIP